MTAFVPGAQHICSDFSASTLRTALAEYKKIADRFGPQSLVGRSAAELAKECEDLLRAKENLTEPEPPPPPPLPADVPFKI